MEPKKWAQQAFIGFGTSAVALTATFPLETLARQFHVTNRANTTSMLLIRNMMTRGVSGFYKGLVPALATQPIYWTFYMHIYQGIILWTYTTYMSAFRIATEKYGLQMPNVFRFKRRA
jgi:hypothetical protein